MPVLVVKLVHILGVLMLFGGMLPLTLFYSRVTSIQDPRARVEGLKLFKLLSQILVTPGSLLAGLSGFALAGMMHLPVFRIPWLMVSILLYAEALVFSLTVLMPASLRLMAAAKAELEPGATPGAFAAALAEPLPRAARMITLVSSLLIVTLMVLKPWP